MRECYLLAWIDVSGPSEIMLVSAGFYSDNERGITTAGTTEAVRVATFTGHDYHAAHERGTEWAAVHAESKRDTFSRRVCRLALEQAS